MRNVNVGTMVFLGIMLMIFQIPTIIGEKEEGTEGNGKDVYKRQVGFTRLTEPANSNPSIPGIIISEIIKS